MLPFVMTAENFEKLRRWEDPRATVCFLVFAYTVIFRQALVASVHNLTSTLRNMQLLQLKFGYHFLC